MVLDQRGRGLFNNDFLGRIPKSTYELFENFEKAKRSPTPAKMMREPRIGSPKGLVTSYVSSDDDHDELEPLQTGEDYSADDKGAMDVRKRTGKNVYNASAYRDARPSFRRKLRDLRLPVVISSFLCTRRKCLVILSVLFVILLSTFGGGHWWLESHGTIHGLSPAWYPTPHGGTTREWEWSYQRASEMVSRMSLVEKVNITTGTGWMMGKCVGNTGPATSVGFPSLCLQDGPLGIRFTENVTAMPAGITVASTWNPNLMYKRARMLGLEARWKGINVLLGPSIGPIGRMPAGGRNWESFGPDPFMESVGAMQTVRGIQEEGVMATLKHFVGNEQEHFRQSYEWALPNALSSNIDDRALHELYAWPFMAGIKAGAASVMCSYNQVNNSYACQNSKLINGVLKDELGFQGFVVSDWLAQRSGVASALAGLDLSMPGDGKSWADGKPYWGSNLAMAALNGSLPMDRLNDMVTRIVASWFKLGQDRPEWFNGPNFSSWTNDQFGVTMPGSNDHDIVWVNAFVNSQGQGGYSHGALARRIAAEGTVLLKNDDEFLPLSRNGYSEIKEAIYKRSKKIFKVAILGEDAAQANDGPNACADRGCNRGTLASGWGSGTAELPYLVSPLDALEGSFDKDRVQLSAFPSNKISSWKRNADLGNQDLCIVFANADSGEGYLSADGIRGDRNDLYLQKDGDKLVQEVANSCGTSLPHDDDGSGVTGNTIVVVHSVGPVVMEKWIEIPNVRAVLWANLPGQESGNALTDVLFGHINPSGKLPYTIGKSLEDYGPGAEVKYFPESIQPQQNFTEGSLIDYRHFDYYNVEPRFEFGYGLSYTTFKLSNMIIEPTVKKPQSLPAPRPDKGAYPPNYDRKIPRARDALFPSGFRKLKKFIYPYIKSTKDIKKGRYPYPKAYPQLLSQAGGGEGGNPDLWTEMVRITVTVQNTGPRDGHAVVQLYLKFPKDVWEDIEEIPIGPGQIPDIILDENGNPVLSNGALAGVEQAGRPIQPPQPVDMGRPAGGRRAAVKRQEPAAEAPAVVDPGVEVQPQAEIAPADPNLPLEPVLIPGIDITADVNPAPDTDPNAPPIVGPNRPPQPAADPNQPPADQNQPPADPNRPPVNPNEPPADPNQPPANLILPPAPPAPPLEDPAQPPPQPPADVAQVGDVLPPEIGQLLPPDIAALPADQLLPPKQPTDHDKPMPGFHRPDPMTGKTARREPIYFPKRQLRGFTKVFIRGSGADAGTVPDPEAQARTHRAGMGRSPVGTNVIWSHAETLEDSNVLKAKDQYRPESGADPMAQSKTSVVLTLTRRDLSYWSVRRQNWVIPRGKFTIEVGLSSRDIQLEGKMWSY